MEHHARDVITASNELSKKKKFLVGFHHASRQAREIYRSTVPTRRLSTAR